MAVSEVPEINPTSEKMTEPSKAAPVAQSKVCINVASIILRSP